MFHALFSLQGEWTKKLWKIQVVQKSIGFYFFFNVHHFALQDFGYKLPVCVYRSNFTLLNAPVPMRQSSSKHPKNLLFCTIPRWKGALSEWNEILDGLWNSWEPNLWLPNLESLFLDDVAAESLLLLPRMTFPHWACQWKLAKSKRAGNASFIEGVAYQEISARFILDLVHAKKRNGHCLIEAS